LQSILKLDAFKPQAFASSSQRLPSYLPWMDVLRFLACFLVIILHCSPNVPVGVGHAGVAIFFSISGFLIGRVLDEDGNLPRFYARRFLRIYPLYFATLALFAVLSFPPFMHDAALRVLSWHNIQYYLTFTFQLSPDADRLPLLLVWTLCVEELFYLLLPILFLLKKRSRIGIALVIIIAVLLVPRFSMLPNGRGLWYVFPLNLFFGVVLALIRPRLIRLRLQFGLPFLAIGCIDVVIANGYIGTGWFSSFGPVSALLCTAAVWSLAVLSFEFPKILEPIRWMGKLSYGMYLLHSFGISIAVRVLAKLPMHGKGTYAAITVTTAVAALAARAMQVCVEEPFLQLRRSLNRNAKLLYVLAGIQVSLIPTGIFLAAIQRMIRR
jgi:peptidoglycan/LPS O-acetylase OafA/YrhL